MIMSHLSHACEPSVRSYSDGDKGVLWKISQCLHHVDICIKDFLKQYSQSLCHWVAKNTCKHAVLKL